MYISNFVSNNINNLYWDAIGNFVWNNVSYFIRASIGSFTAYNIKDEIIKELENITM